MVAWYVDKGLAHLIAQWRAEHPGASVGTIGDAAHQGEYSEHNPEADGSVDAADFMVGNGVTMDMLRELADQLAAHRDKRLLYLIIDQKIFSNNAGQAMWAWRYYDGDYHDHLHVSVNDNYESDGSAWNVGEENDVELTDGIYKGTPSSSWTRRFPESDPTVRNAMAFSAFYAYDAAKGTGEIVKRLDTMNATLEKIADLLAQKK